MRIRPARDDEVDELTALALRSKAHWGYDPDFVERCRPLLTVTPADLVGKRLLVAEDAGLLGFVGLAGLAPVGELTDLWVDPTTIGRGVGRVLFRHAVRLAAGAGMTAFTIEADPNATGFYQAMGAELFSTAPSTVLVGRELPVLRYRLDGPGRPAPA